MKGRQHPLVGGCAIKEPRSRPNPECDWDGRPGSQFTKKRTWQNKKNAVAEASPRKGSKSVGQRTEKGHSAVDLTQRGNGLNGGLRAASPGAQ